MAQDHSKEIVQLFHGDWNAQDILINEINSSRIVNKELESKSLSSWNEKITESRKSNKKLWDSELYRFENYQVNNSILLLTISTIQFSVRFGMNDQVSVLKSLDIQHAPKGLFTSCLVRTSDNVYVFIEKSDKYFTNKKYAWVGGVISKTEGEIRSGLDLFRVAKNEIKEELGVDENQLHGEPTLRAGYITENWNVCFLFSQALSVSVEELKKHFAERNDGEAKNLLFINQNNLNDYLSLFEKKDQIKFAVLEII